MVRVGGGWASLDEFLIKHDPCRGKNDLALLLLVSFHFKNLPCFFYFIFVFLFCLAFINFIFIIFILFLFLFVLLALFLDDFLFCLLDFDFNLVD